MLREAAASACVFDSKIVLLFDPSVLWSMADNSVNGRDGV